MFWVSLRRSPCARERDSRSLPARSIKFSEPAGIGQNRSNRIQSIDKKEEERCTSATPVQ